jgi:Protein of unknown function (DUF2795)
VNAQRAAEIQVVLEGIRLPATRGELIAYARSWDPAAATELEAIPDRAYDRIDEVGEALLRVQPAVYVLRQQDAGAASNGADAGEEHAPVGASPL